MHKSQIFSLLGHNGAGKTTLISILTGLYEMSSGKVTLHGKDLKNDIDHIWK